MKTCFVVSQIADAKSDTRKHSDDVFDLIIQPALEKFQISVLRADQIPGTSSITSDVIRHIQEADLCVIDLTGNNPNVFYECGRRHETGKPYIQLLKTGEKLPFDVHDIRTIMYEISNPRDVRKTVLEIQTFVETFINSGKGATGSVTSLSTIVDALNKIDNKLSVLMTQSRTSISVGSGPSDLEIGIFESPLAIAREAIENGDIDKLAAVAPRLERIASADSFATVAVALCKQGFPFGSEAAVRLLKERADQLSADNFHAVMSSLLEYFSIRDEEAKGIVIYENFLKDLPYPEGSLPEDIAYTKNRVHMMYYAVGNYDKALELLEQASTLRPNFGPHAYNRSILYEAKGMHEAALRSALEAMDLGNLNGGPDADYFERAIKLGVKAGKTELVETIFADLAKLNPRKASSLRRSLGLSA